MERLNIDEAVPIEHGIVNKSIEQSQTRVEGANFDVRKHLLEYDDVMNKQRENVYGLRRELLEGAIRVDDDGEVEEVDTRTYLMTLAEDAVNETVQSYCGEEIEPEEWDLDAAKLSSGGGCDVFWLSLKNLKTHPSRYSNRNQLEIF